MQWPSFAGGLLGEAGEQLDAHLQLGYLAMEGAGHDPLAQQLDAAHLGLYETAEVVAAPSLTVAAFQALDRAHRLVACQCTGGKPQLSSSTVARCGVRG